MGLKNYLLLVLIMLGASSHAQDKWTQKSAEAAQEKLNKEYANKAESPLTDEDFKNFKGLDFYPISDRLAVEAKFIRTTNEKVFNMKTTGARTPEYIKYGELLFSIDGKPYHLYVYQNIELTKREGYADYLFLPFLDLTCGKESYIGGRYIDMRIPKANKVIVDFNTAYNPYCAYNHKYSCPIVPLENDLNIAIPAGVKKYHD